MDGGSRALCNVMELSEQRWPSHIADCANSGFAPDILSDFDDQRQLAHLLIFAECITAGHTGKPALTARGFSDDDDAY